MGRGPQYPGADPEVALSGRVRALEAEPQLLPPIPHPARPFQSLSAALDGYMDITSGGLVTCWDTIVDRLVHRGVFVRIPWQTQAGTTGELRLLVNGFRASSAVALPAASSGELTFRFLHFLTLWTTVDAPLAIQARRTGGANAVRIGPPYTGFVQVDPRGCTSTGI
jgi:hypothetical protein